MKKNMLLKAICLLCLCCLILLSTVLSTAALTTYVRGDADCDGVVTVFDANAIQRTLINMPTPSFYERAADVDNNGLDISDATKIQRYLAQFEDPYKIYTTVKFDEYELPVV